MSVLDPRMREEYRRDGFVRVEQACSADLGACRRRVEEYISASDSPAVFRFGKGGEKIHCKIPQLAERDEVFRRLAQDPRLVSIVEELIGPARIFRDVLIAKPPRAGSVVRYHQDAAYWDVDPPDLALSAWIALDDASQEAGCLRVLPGSQAIQFPHGLAIGGRRVPDWLAAFLRGAVSLTGTGDNPQTSRERAFARAKKLVLGRATRLVPTLSDLNELHVESRSVPEERTVPLPAKAGDVIFFHSRLLHGSGRNTSPNPRRAYIVSYMAAGCRVGREDSSRFLAARA